MLRFIHRMLTLAGPYGKRIRGAFVLSFLENALANMPILAVWFIFSQILADNLRMNHVWISAAALIGAVVLRFFLRRAFVSLQSGAGYEICARDRIAIGDRFKRFPMGYFTEGNLGQVTSAVSVDLLFVEQHGMDAMDKVINGYINIGIACLFLFFIDWRVALSAVVTCMAAWLVLRHLQTVSSVQSFIRQRQQAQLTSAVLEYIRGIAVIKSLHMDGDKARQMKDAIQTTRNHSIEYEEKFTPPGFYYQTCFSAGITAIVFLSAWFAWQGTMSLPVMLMLIVFAFYMYLPAQALGGLTNKIRVMEAGLDRYEKLQQVEIIDQDGQARQLDHFDIVFDKVRFAYEEKAVLQDISFTAAEKSMTALVGASGSGKTTIANLIARFWDVQAGEVRIGGVNVKELTCDSLLKNISMVFQKVYLFHDTVLNNIRFGKPDATMEEVVAAAQKARCHDFIMALENGYDTVVGAGGCSLSGGEKQRISIARAILKDAPIILLDEATASVDPDNEKCIQEAINELVKDKTLIVIAHRLSTIRQADQILVIHDGQIVQRGRHDELLSAGGQYASLWQKRTQSQGWKIVDETSRVAVIPDRVG